MNPKQAKKWLLILWLAVGIPLGAVCGLAANWHRAVLADLRADPIIHAMEQDRRSQAMLDATLAPDVLRRNVYAALSVGFFGAPLFYWLYRRVRSKTTEAVTRKVFRPFQSADKPEGEAEQGNEQGATKRRKPMIYGFAALSSIAAIAVAYLLLGSSEPSEEKAKEASALCREFIGKEMRSQGAFPKSIETKVFDVWTKRGAIVMDIGFREEYTDSSYSMRKCVYDEAKGTLSSPSPLNDSDWKK
jgi:hypothetical protein